MKKFLTSKKGIALFATMVVAIATAVGAYAYWTQGGGGSGTAATGTTTDITVNQLSTPTAMFPGSTPQALSGNFDNPNPGAVQISSVTAVVSSVTGAGNDLAKPACTTADYQIAGTSGLNLVPTGGAGVGSWSGLTIQLLNTAFNQDNCKNAVAHITYTANP
jgi:hypothetical protein